MAVAFDGGSTDKLSYTSDYAANFIEVDSAITVAAWVKHDGTASASNFFSADGGSFQITQWLVDASRKLQCFIRTPGTNLNVVTTDTIDANVWTHICWEWDGTNTTNFDWYINGTVVSGYDTSVAPNADIYVDQTGVVIGTSNSDSAFYGSIEHLAVWKSSLAQADITRLANGIPPNLVGSPYLYMPLLDTSAKNINDTIAGENATTAGTPTDDTDRAPVYLNAINVTPQTATANYINRSTGKFISHEDMGSPAAGDMMRLRVLRDYDHVANTDDMQLHKLVLWQKGDA